MMLLRELCEWSLADERTLKKGLGGGGSGGGGGGEKETAVMLESKVRRTCDGGIYRALWLISCCC